MKRRAALTAVATVTATLAVAAPAAAHGLVGKQDLPIPRWLFAWAAATVLVISFIGLVVLWPTARLERARERMLLGLPAFVEPVCGALGVLVFAGLVYAGFAGSQTATSNILPTVVYVSFWVGIPFASLVFGDVFRAFNPWRAIGRAAGWAAQRIMPGPPPAPLPYPERLGRWPAAVGILLFAGLELAFTGRNDPSTLATLALAYAAVQFVGMSLYGVQAWTDRGDAFAVYFGLFASLAPLRWTRRALLVRPPLTGTARILAVPGTVALLAVMIGSTSFDGFTVNAIWTSLGQSLAATFIDAGLSADIALELAFFLGLLAMIAVIAALYLLACAGMRSVSGAASHSTLGLAQRFAPTLVPIALAYVIGHYVGLLSYQTQALGYLLSDPLGTGANIFGTATATIDYTWITSTQIWYLQVAALVIGHACGLALAHDRALALFGDAKTASRSQYWMLAVMIIFTSLALFILSTE